MKESACKAAMVALPLAVAVPYAAAGPVLPTGNGFGCTAHSDTQNSSCTGQVSLGTLAGSPITGFQFTSQSPIQLSNLNSATDTYTFLTGGTLTGGSLSGTLPVSANFTVTGGVASGSWSVLFELGSSSGASNFGSTTLTGATNPFPNTTTGASFGNISIVGTINSGSSVFETIVATFPVHPNTTINFSFPLAMGSGAVSATPEPASIGVSAGGLGLLALLFRRRRNRA